MIKQTICSRLFSSQSTLYIPSANKHIKIHPIVSNDIYNFTFPEKSKLVNEMESTLLWTFYACNIFINPGVTKKEQKEADIC